MLRISAPKELLRPITLGGSVKVGCARCCLRFQCLHAPHAHSNARF